MLLRTHGGILSPLRLQGQGLLHAHQIKEIDDAPHLPKEASGGAVLADFPELLLGSYPYFDNPVYSIKLTLESKDAGYLERAHSMLLIELAKIQLVPIQGN